VWAEDQSGAAEGLQVGAGSASPLVVTPPGWGASPGAGHGPSVYCAGVSVRLSDSRGTLVGR
jgi:hypothetical protein